MTSSTPMATYNFSSLGRLQMAHQDVGVHAGAGTHRLVVPTMLSASWLSDDTDVAFVLLSGSVYLTQPSHRFAGELNTQVADVRAFPTTFDLSVAVTDEQLAGIEQARGQDDVALNLKVQVALLQPPPGVHATHAQDVQVRVRSSHWVTLLDQLGAQVALIVRVPSPLTDPQLFGSPQGAAGGETIPSLTQATRRLRQAREHLRDGRWDDCVGACRLVLDNISALRDVPSDARVGAVKPRDRDLELRWAAAFHAVNSIASAAHHDDKTTDDFVWSQPDAEAMLATTAALLRRYAP